MQQGLAYIIDGKPRLAWTSEDNLQSLIAALPTGTSYELVTAETAEAWWKAHLPAREQILNAIAALEAKQTPRMIRGATLGKSEDAAMLAGIEAEIAALRAELAGSA